MSWLSGSISPSSPVGWPFSGRTSVTFRCPASRNCTIPYAMASLLVRSGWTRGARNVWARSSIDRGASEPALRGDDDDAAGAPRAVHRGGARVLQHLDARHVAGVDAGEDALHVPVDREPIDDVERLVAGDHGV